MSKKSKRWYLKKACAELGIPHPKMGHENFLKHLKEVRKLKEKGLAAELQEPVYVPPPLISGDGQCFYCGGYHPSGMPCPKFSVTTTSDTEREGE